MALVAITREMGSLGIDVGQNIAASLGVPLIHHEIIDVVADKMRVRRSHVVRMLDGKATLYEKLTAADTKASLLTAAEILDLACDPRGAVLRGWGAAFLLHSVPHAVCARVCAPRWLRTQRMMERLNTDDPQAAETEVRLNDEAHAAVMKRNLNVDTQNAENYDVVLSTERLSVDDATEELLHVTRNHAFDETEASRQKLLDLRLQAHVRVALRIHPRTRDARVGISARRGIVTLSGIVRNEADQREIVQVATAVDSVEEVRPDLRAADASRPWGNG